MATPAGLADRGFLRLLLLSGVIGVPIALVCFFFVGLQHELQHWVWESLPHAVGYNRAPWWWPLPALLLAGLLLVPVLTRFPGHGGHVPADGLMSGDPIGPRDLPGVILAALTVLPLGAVLGPEAPLMAVGSGLALLAARSAGPAASKVLGTAGSTAAIATILGGPLPAAVLVLEGAAGLAGARTAMLLLPCLLASGAGALVFTGFGHWTGLSIGALTLPDVPKEGTPDAGDFLWGVPLAVLIAVVIACGHRLGRATAAWTGRDAAARTVLCAVAVGGLLAAYALVTGRSPQEAALSGQATLAQLAAAPGAWAVGTLLALVVCKGLAWAVCLGSMRGGPIFPALLLGAAIAVAASGLPGLGAAPALALGLTAGMTALTRLPVASAVFTGLLMGNAAVAQMPLILVSAVVALVTVEWLPERSG
ncbi:putative ion-transport protein YfeO [Streptomyces sp. RB5]|uniref:Putative ion-transport protein YfeO n=1 Tax=Streptomyces smaragdinus TaxID=2585196 RepID=A0A7K0CPM7_9ACTN|nr:chloride channel protein [Streptomyces smaragdinus]MQY15437.1 putative ion-transport protein YfeO [Streptomyces smaragdinus]